MKRDDFVVTMKIPVYVISLRCHHSRACCSVESYILFFVYHFVLFVKKKNDRR